MWRVWYVGFQKGVAEIMVENQSIRNTTLITIAKVVALLLVLYVFFFSLELMGASFKLMGKGFAKQMLATTSNPFVGLFIGVLVTSVVQSSSTVTSLVVGMVAGGMLSITNAIPIVMGANIGTSITNIIVSLGHIRNDVEFKRAFSASVVHDFFNILTVAWLLPLQIFFGVLEKPALMLASAFENVGGMNLLSIVKVVTKPLAHFVIDVTGGIAWISALIAVAALFIALRYLVKVLKMLVVGKVEAWFKTRLFKTAGRALVLGMALTVLVQSSSITTSFIVPIVGAGILTIQQIFPYTLGANVGTTITAIIAALVIATPEALTVAFAHLLFNIFGIAAIWKFQFIPIKMAQTLAAGCAKRKYVAFLFILITFFVIPITLIFLAR